MIFLAPAIIVGLVISGSAASAASQPNGDKMLPAHWVSFRHIPAVVDLAGPRRNGQLTLAARRTLVALRPNRSR